MKGLKLTTLHNLGQVCVLIFCRVSSGRQNEPQKDPNSQPSVHKPLSIVLSGINFVVLLENVVRSHHSAHLFHIWSQKVVGLNPEPVCRVVLTVSAWDLCSFLSSLAAKTLLKLHPPSWLSRFVYCSSIPTNAPGSLWFKGCIRTNLNTVKQ